MRCGRRQAFHGGLIGSGEKITKAVLAVYARFDAPDLRAVPQTAATDGRRYVREQGVREPLRERPRRVRGEPSGAPAIRTLLRRNIHLVPSNELQVEQRRRFGWLRGRCYRSDLPKGPAQNLADLF